LAEAADIKRPDNTLGTTWCAGANEDASEFAPVPTTLPQAAGLVAEGFPFYREVSIASGDYLSRDCPVKKDAVDLKAPATAHHA
jgi:hypothetical protein